MGIVHLTNSHHELYIHNKQPDLGQRIVLDEDLLARPILNNSRHPFNHSAQRMIRNALHGLLELHGFDAAVSYNVAERDGIPHIRLPQRVWGEITLGSPSNVVVGFSHDTRYENRPFYNLVEWLEEEGPNGNLNEEEFSQFVDRWLSQKWRRFFEARIRSKIKRMQSDAEFLRRQADETIAKAASIKAALGLF